MFTAGNKANPLGRNVSKPLSDAVRALLTRPAGDALDDEPKTIAQEIALNIVRAAMKDKGSFKAFENVRDTAEGRPTQTIAGDPNSPIVTVNKTDDKTILEHFFKKMAKDQK